MFCQYGFIWKNYNSISTIKKIDNTIEKIMGEKWYTKHREDLKRHNIMFLGQCTNLNSTKLLEWTQLINPRTQGKKRKPRWYSELENKIINPYNTERLIPNRHPQENIFHQYIEGSLTRAT
jgi:hypothetical protein